MTLLDLIALRQAIASGHIDPESEYVEGNTITTRWYCYSEPSCDDCALYKQCDEWYNADSWYAQLKTLPDFALLLDELQSKYPELFI